jgi:hypothetical protein
MFEFNRIFKISIGILRSLKIKSLFKNTFQKKKKSFA